VLLGGLGAAGGLLQRRMDMPDATVMVLQGFIFVAILASDTLLGRFQWFQPRRTDS
jgi:simple sugar transport system permease protein